MNRKSKSELLFSVTKNDFEMQKFRAGGKGGQSQNKTSSGVRLIHKASGARGESREHKSFLQNRKAAFLRLVESKEFKAWYKIETARKMGTAIDIEKNVELSMQSSNLKVEVRDSNGKWTTLD